ncbi:hypothetical protein AVEN_158400-1 [Araneus ventricosus]|uniref:Uncharacterized protein n=1 Tax=Araneus ventricosus TaxID=182803 RepID=A0A4Y2VE53_ARAVE|nr:hypothetical protein AVEN_158400-1 [Araneus ventricosus]
MSAISTEVNSCPRDTQQMRLNNLILESMACLAGGTIDVSTRHSLGQGAVTPESKVLASGPEGSRFEAWFHQRYDMCMPGSPGDLWKRFRINFGLAGSSDVRGERRTTLERVPTCTANPFVFAEIPTGFDSGTVRFTSEYAPLRGAVESKRQCAIS